MPAHYAQPAPAAGFTGSQPAGTTGTRTVACMSSPRIIGVAAVAATVILQLFWVAVLVYLLAMAID